MFRHALEQLQPDRSGGENEQQEQCFLQKRLTVTDLYEGPWLVGRRFRRYIALTLRLQLKTWPCHPLSFMAVNMISKYVTVEQIFRMVFVTEKYQGVYLEPARM